MFDAPERRIRQLFSLIDIERYTAWIQWSHDTPPEPYNRQTPITKRAHLYAIPAPASQH
jgi:hypothetical protein